MEGYCNCCDQPIRQIEQQIYYGRCEDCYALEVNGHYRPAPADYGAPAMIWCDTGRVPLKSGAYRYTRGVFGG